MPAPDRSTNRARRGRRAADARSREDVAAHGITGIPEVVSAAALATVASRPWTRSGSASDSPPPSPS